MGLTRRPLGQCDVAGAWAFVARARRAGWGLASGVLLCLLAGCPQSHRAKPDSAAPKPMTPAALFATYCGPCHAKPASHRIPTREMLSQLSVKRIVSTLTYGAMKPQAAALTAAQRRQVAQYLSKAKPAVVKRCAKDHPFSLEGPKWSGWGNGPGNTRFQADTALGATKLGQLKRKWVFSYSSTALADGAIAVHGGVVFVGNFNGLVYALSAATGCAYWTFEANSSVRTAPALGGTTKEPVVYFGDRQAFVYALDARTGRLRWKQRVHEHVVARIVATPILHAGRLYATTSSAEATSAMDPTYPCCKFRGNLTALDAASGKILWRRYTIDKVPAPTKKNPKGAQMWGPSGAPVWASPTVDAKLNRIYIGTGQNYSPPATDTSDAVLAVDAAKGKVVWKHQLTPNDVWNMACVYDKGAEGNCRWKSGPDFDIGAAPLLRVVDKKQRLLIVAQKSGNVVALDPDDGGKLKWRRKVGRGGTLGGVHWGMAADDRSVYVGVSDRLVIEDLRMGKIKVRPGDAPGSLLALDLATGKVRWQKRTPAPSAACLKRNAKTGTPTSRTRCTGAISAAVTATPGLVWVGALDGTLRAYDAKTGEVKWTTDTLRLQHENTRFGSIDGGGPIVVGPRLFVNSGYGRFNQLPGNALVAFSLE